MHASRPRHSAQVGALVTVKYKGYRGYVYKLAGYAGPQLPGHRSAVLEYESYDGPGEPDHKGADVAERLLRRVES